MNKNHIKQLESVEKALWEIDCSFDVLDSIGGDVACLIETARGFYSEMLKKLKEGNSLEGRYADLDFIKTAWKLSAQKGAEGDVKGCKQLIEIAESMERMANV